MNSSVLLMLGFAAALAEYLPRDMLWLLAAREKCHGMARSNFENAAFGDDIQKAICDDVEQQWSRVA